jgi:hypothetical protein
VASALSFLALAAGPALAATAAPSSIRPARQVCTGGVVPSGVYTVLRIVGACSESAFGQIRVLGNVIISGGASLTDDYGRLDIGGNVTVGEGGALTIGCQPHTAACPPDPDHAAGPATAAAPRVAIAGAVHGHDIRLILVNQSGDDNDIVVFQPPPQAGADQERGISDTAAPGSGNNAMSRGRNALIPSCAAADTSADSGRQVLIQGVQIGGPVVVKGLDCDRIDISDDKIADDLVVDGDRTTGTGSSRFAPDLSGDRVGGSIDCTHDRPAPSDDGDPDHAHRGLHGECRDD